MDIRQFFFTYVLHCVDGHRYVGQTTDLEQRMAQHRAGVVDATRHRRPVTLVYFEACLCPKAAIEREQQLKTGFGRAYLQRRIPSTPAP